ncbi:MAG: hypothetical protein ACM3ZF_08160 [Mycobacterium leprae]
MSDPSPSRESRWPGVASVAFALVLHLALPQPLTVAPSYVVPLIEGVLLVLLVLGNPGRLTPESRDMQILSVGIIALLAAANFASLGLLVRTLVDGAAIEGRVLLASGLAIWSTNVIVFALVFWELDRGGPLARSLGRTRAPDLLFPQMSLEGYAGWTPTYADYLYVSFTNAAAFSPTDTMPLRGRVKMLFLGEALASLVTLGVILARAVNVLR